MSDHGTEGRGLRTAPLLVRTSEQLAEAVAHLERFDTFVLDVETDSANPITNEVIWVGFAVPDRVVLIPMGHPLGRMLTPATTEKRLPPEEDRSVLKSGKLSNAKKTYHVPATFDDPGPQLRQDKVFDALRPLLFSDRTKVGHNLKFDLESVAKYYGEVPPGPYEDTMILTHVLNENLPRYGLKTLVMDWLGVPRDPRARSAFYPEIGRKGILIHPIDEVARYLAKDVWYTLLYARFHRRRVQRIPELWETFRLEMSLYPVLMEMERTGIRIDTDLLAERGRKLAQEIEAITHQAWDICGEQFPISNPSQKRHFLFAAKKDGGQGLKPLSFTEKTHTPQLNTETLEHYAEVNDLARLFLEWADKDKLYGTFITGLTEKVIDGRLHTSFNQHRTVTGRLSSVNPNLQQIPRGGSIRDTFVADPGYLLVVADYDQVELRCAAALSRDPAMVQVFREGRDIHAQAAAAMYGLALGDITADQRQVGKTQNFGTLYGAGPAKIALVADCTQERAKEFIARYYEQFSGLSAWKDLMVVQARNTGSRRDGRTPYTEIPPFGRRRRLPDLYADDDGLRARAERQVINAVVQGFAACIMKLALIDLHVALADSPYQLLLNVHDEVVVQAPEAEIEDAQEVVVTTMENVQFQGLPILGSVPLTAEGGIGKSWSEAK